MSHTKDFVLRDNEMYDFVTHGIIGASVENGLVENNDMHDIGFTDIQCYGIAMSRSKGTLTDRPRTKDVLITGNRVSNNPHWEGIDTHAGENIRIVNNIVKDCKLGIITTRDSDNDLGPINCIASENVIERIDLSTNEVRAGLQCVGGYSTNEYAENCKLINNTVIGYGEKGSEIPSRSAAVYVSTANNFECSGNIIKNNGMNGIYLDIIGENVNIFNNTIIGDESNSGKAITVHRSGGLCTGKIDANVIKNANTGIYFTSVATGMHMGKNYNEATIPYDQAGGVYANQYVGNIDVVAEDMIANDFGSIPAGGYESFTTGPIDGVNAIQAVSFGVNRDLNGLIMQAKCNGIQGSTTQGTITFTLYNNTDSAVDLYTLNIRYKVFQAI